ncbi:MAG: hypothetical protein V1918_07550 [Planctomycetota bacterium]
MSSWRAIQPVALVFPVADILAGSGIVSFAYRYLDWRSAGGVLLLCLAAVCLNAAGHLLEACLSASGRGGGSFSGAFLMSRRTLTRVFLAGGFLCFAGLFLAMKVGVESFVVAACWALVMLFQVLPARQSELRRALLQGALRGGQLLLGMSIYPGFFLAGPAPLLLAPAILMGLWVPAARLALPLEREGGARLLVAASALGVLALLGAAGAVLPPDLLARVLLGGALLFWLVGSLRAYGIPHPRRLGQYVALSLSGLVLVEAAWVAALGSGAGWHWRAFYLAPLVGLFCLAVSRMNRLVQVPEAP